MSSLPPPPPGPPSVPPPPPPPPYQGQYMPAAPPPTPGSSKSKTGLVIGAIALVAVLGVGAFVLMSGDDDETSNSLSTNAMLAAVQALVTRAGAEPGDSVALDRCPAGEMAALATQAPTEVQTVAEASTEPQAFVYQPDVSGSLALVNCTLDDPTFESGIGIAFGEAVSDYRSDLVRVLPEFELTFGTETAHEGGTLLRYCAEPRDPEAGYRPFCEADWFDDNVWVGVFLASSDTASEIAEEWLVAVLPGVISAVTTNAPTVETETT
ncbi:MAG: hypothetical protein Q8M22_15235 [Actinomycetota bacterium]|nr:hypothetical protein [Actinomycetota bacterium]